MVSLKPGEKECFCAQLCVHSWCVHAHTYAQHILQDIQHPQHVSKLVRTFMITDPENTRSHKQCNLEEACLESFREAIHIAELEFCPNTKPKVMGECVFTMHGCFTSLLAYAPAHTCLLPLESRKGQTKESLKLELKTVVSHQVGAVIL